MSKIEQDEVLRMAREAEFWKGTNGLWMCDTNDLERFAALVAAHVKSDQINLAYQQGYEEGSAHEREACAKVCEEEAAAWARLNAQDEEGYGAIQCAAAIRSRCSQESRSEK